MARSRASLGVSLISRFLVADSSSCPSLWNICNKSLLLASTRWLGFVVMLTLINLNNDQSTRLGSTETPPIDSGVELAPRGVSLCVCVVNSQARVYFSRKSFIG